MREIRLRVCGSREPLTWGSISPGEACLPSPSNQSPLISFLPLLSLFLLHSPPLSALSSSSLPPLLLSYPLLASPPSQPPLPQCFLASPLFPSPTFSLFPLSSSFFPSPLLSTPSPPPPPPPPSSPPLPFVPTRVSFESYTRNYTSHFPRLTPAPSPPPPPPSPPPSPPPPPR